jgi:phasin family protein
MNKDAFQMWDQMGNAGVTSVQSLVRLNEITSRVVERMAQQQLAVVGGCFESGLNQLKMLSEAKGLQDVLLGQTRLATQCSEKWMESARKLLEISLDSQGELSQWMNDGFNTMSSQAKKAAAETVQSVQQAA